jgi:hypothetical protein
MIWAVTTQPMANAIVTTQISNHIGGPSVGLPPPNAYEGVRFHQIRPTVSETGQWRNAAERRLRWFLSPSEPPPG